MQETDICLEYPQEPPITGLRGDLQEPPITGLIGYLLVSFLLLVPTLMQKFWRDTKVPAHLYRKTPQGYQ